MRLIGARSVLWISGRSLLCSYETRRKFSPVTTTYASCVSFPKVMFKQRKRVTEQNESTLAQLKKGSYGAFCVSHDTIFNLSDVKLTDLQKDILCRGPRFGLPHTTANEDVLYEFELFYRRLSKFTPCSRNAVVQWRSALDAFAHEYANKGSDLRSFSLGREHMVTLRDLGKNNKLVITRPDKGW